MQHIEIYPEIPDPASAWAGGLAWLQKCHDGPNL